MTLMPDHTEFDALTRTDFNIFAERVFVELNGSEPYVDNFHIGLICCELEAVRRGEVRRLAIALPPRSLKSIIVSVAYPAWLLGQGRAMRPSHASKGPVRYRYYISFENNGQASTIRAERIAAGDLEPLVLTALRQLLIDRSALVGLLCRECDAEATAALLAQANALTLTIDTGLPLGQRVLFDELDLQLVIDGNSLRADIDLHRLGLRLGIEPEDVAEGRHPVMIAPRPPRRGHEIRLIVPGDNEVPVQRDGRLVMLLLKAQAARQQLLATDKSATSPSIYSDKHVARLARLSWLAPDIVCAILEGKQPRSLTARQLLRATEVPLAWPDQRRMFGLA